jgi:hypothetical protein
MQDGIFEFADEQVLGEGQWLAFLKSWSRQLHNDTKVLPQLNSFLLIVTSIVFGDIWPQDQLENWKICIFSFNYFEENQDVLIFVKNLQKRWDFHQIIQ